MSICTLAFFFKKSTASTSVDNGSMERRYPHTCIVTKCPLSFRCRRPYFETSWSEARDDIPHVAYTKRTRPSYMPGGCQFSREHEFRPAYKPQLMKYEFRLRLKEDGLQPRVRSSKQICRNTTIFGATTFCYDSCVNAFHPVSWIT